MDDARSIREFWFGEEPLTPEAFTARLPFWFGGEEDTALQAQRDGVIRTRFAPLLERAAAGELDGWADGPRRRLSLILLLDQFPRNIFRGTAQAFAFDHPALALTLSGMQLAADAALGPAERAFFYMPLQHAENLEVQEESVLAYRRLVRESPEGWRAPLAGTLRYAEVHREIVVRFGRFPHRNAVLGRASTPEEEAYLADGAERFGQ
jgi:uncharacterized protein (DUF924 family)